MPALVYTMRRPSGALLLGEYEEQDVGRLENEEECEVSRGARGDEITGSEKSDRLSSNCDIVVSLILFDL
jgi:hypothetical protein